MMSGMSLRKRLGTGWFHGDMILWTRCSIYGEERKGLQVSV